MISADPPTVAIAVRTVAVVDGTDALGLAVVAVGEGVGVVNGVLVPGTAGEPPAVAAKAIPPAIAATDNPAMAIVLPRVLMDFSFLNRVVERSDGGSVKGSVEQACS
jgi:hypothetical protein